MPSTPINPRVIAGRSARPGAPGDTPNHVEAGEVWLHRTPHCGGWTDATHCRVEAVADGYVTFWTARAKWPFRIPESRVVCARVWRRLLRAPGASVSEKEAGE
jgi:hypothetical protein